MTCYVVVKKKGQITIPVNLRRKLDINENSRLEIVEHQDAILLRKCHNIFDLAGSDAGKARVAELKQMLDQMRNEDT